MEKRSNLSKGEEKIPLQICDIILPTAPIQTKQGCVSGFHLVLPPPSLLILSLLLLSLLFFLSVEKVGGGRERWQNSRRLEVCPIPALNSAPQLLWLETGLVSVSFCLNHSLPSPRTPLSLLVPYQRLFAQRPSFWEVLEKPARGIYQEDNVQKSSLQSFYISESVFLFFINKYSGAQLLQLRVSVKFCKKPGSFYK